MNACSRACFAPATQAFGCGHSFYLWTKTVDYATLIDEFPLFDLRSDLNVYTDYKSKKAKTRGGDAESKSYRFVS